MQNPKLELYRIFQTTSQSESYTEAGRKLFMTQSAVSQSIHQLEQILGATLFSRMGRRMVLTDAGKTLQTHLEQAFLSIEKAEQSVRAIEQLSEGTLHVASSDTLCRYRLLPLLNQFHQQYPNIRLQITNRPSPVCIEWVSNGLADIALVNRPETSPGDLVFYDIQPYTDCFVGGARYRGFSEKETPLESLVSLPLILLESDASTRQNLNRWVTQQGLAVNPEIELGSVEILLELVKMNLGIGWIPGYALPSALEAGLFQLKTVEASPTRHIALTKSTQRPLSKATEAFLELALKEKPLL